MKKKQRTLDIMTLFQDFKSAVLDKQPPPNQMVADVQMMKFKIRPLQGDVTRIDFANMGFVETLWKLGKMDDFIERYMKKIDKKQESIFFNYFDSLYYHLQEKLNSLNLHGQGALRTPSHKSHIEMEIFKMRSRKKQMN